jgi:LCP family protein required for cell wall assembly
VARRNGESTRSRPAKKRRRPLVWVGAGVAVVLVAVVAFAGFGYVYGYLKYSSIQRACAACQTESAVPNAPFNVLEIGSDSRVGLTGQQAAATGAGSVAGQRSDVVKIMHVDPQTLTVSVISIPRDTMVTLLANQNLYTRYNRINVNYANGNPDLLIHTIEANFGIPINHVVGVSFGGLIKAANSLNGVWLDFPYPAHDPYSGLNITHTGCQIMRDFRALAVVRSRHYYYNPSGRTYWPPNGVNMSDSTLQSQYGWVADYSSDYGRIQRQDAFIRALINRAKTSISIGAIYGLLQSIPQGITVDSKLGYNEMLGLALKFRHFNSANLHSYTLPVASGGYVAPYGDVLFVQQPAAQKLLVKVFGSQLKRPTNPPPGPNLQPNPPPNIPLPTTTTTVAGSHSSSGSHSSGSGSGSSSKPTTTTTVPPASEYASYNPYPCSPK